MLKSLITLSNTGDTINTLFSRNYAAVFDKELFYSDFEMW